MTEITKKLWGTTTLLLRTPFIEVHRLSINPMSWCSEHLHTSKWNAFYVESGTLLLETFTPEHVQSRMQPGSFATIPPGHAHQFRTGKERVTCLEIYYPAEVGEDIVRQTAGGTAWL